MYIYNICIIGCLKSLSHNFISPSTEGSDRNNEELRTFLLTESRNEYELYILSFILNKNTMMLVTIGKT